LKRDYLTLNDGSFGFKYGITLKFCFANSDFSYLTLIFRFLGDIILNSDS
jgi:hypothetical protein